MLAAGGPLGGVVLPVALGVGLAAVLGVGLAAVLGVGLAVGGVLACAALFTC